MKNKIITVVFLLLMLGGVVLFALPKDEAGFKRENRSAAAMPELNSENIFSGKFSSEFESFVDDNIAMRSDLTAFSSFIESSRGIKPPGGKVIYSQKDIGTQTVKKASLLLLDHTLMEVFTSDTEAEDLYISRINEIAQNNPTVNTFCMIVPTQLEFCEPIYRNIQNSQKKTIDYIYSNLNGNITPVDAYSALEGHSDEYLYFRTDHHWTMLGAYYGYSAFMKSQGIPPVSRNDFTKHTVRNFFGPLSSELDSSDLKELKADEIQWWDTQEKNEISTRMFGYSSGTAEEYHASPLLDETQEDYSLFLTSDHPLAVITNSKIINDKTLLIIKDSYANDFVPWLVNNYQNILMIDPRGFKGSIAEIVNEYDVDDLLIMNYIFTPTFTDYSDLLGEIQ